MSASHRRTRERFLALYEITQEICATRVAAQARRYPQTVMEWLHLYWVTCHEIGHSVARTA